MLMPALHYNANNIKCCWTCLHRCTLPVSFACSSNRLLPLSRALRSSSAHPVSTINQYQSPVVGLPAVPVLIGRVQLQNARSYHLRRIWSEFCRLHVT